MHSQNWTEVCTPEMFQKQCTESGVGLAPNLQSSPPWPDVHAFCWIFMLGVRAFHVVSNHRSRPSLDVLLAYVLLEVLAFFSQQCSSQRSPFALHYCCKCWPSLTSTSLPLSHRIRHQVLRIMSVLACWSCTLHSWQSQGPVCTTDHLFEVHQGSTHLLACRFKTSDARGFLWPTLKA